MHIATSWENPFGRLPKTSDLIRTHEEQQRLLPFLKYYADEVAEAVGNNSPRSLLNSEVEADIEIFHHDLTGEPDTLFSYNLNIRGNIVLVPDKPKSAPAVFDDLFPLVPAKGLRAVSDTAGYKAGQTIEHVRIIHLPVLDFMTVWIGAAERPIHAIRPPKVTRIPNPFANVSQHRN